MGGNCYRCRLMKFVAARMSRIQFAQRYVMCIYRVRITFVLFTPVPETGCPMWHAGLTLPLTLTSSGKSAYKIADIDYLQRMVASVFFYIRLSAHRKSSCAIELVSLPCVWLHRKLIN